MGGASIPARPNEQPEAAASGTRDRSDLRLHGPWIAAARVAWIVAALVVLGLDMLGTPVLFAQMHAGCDGAQCINLQLTTARLHGLLRSGLSVTFVAVYVTALYWIGSLVYATIAAVIFWRRSDDRMAIFGSFTLLAFGAGPVFGTMKALPNSNPLWAPPINLVNLVGTVSFYLFFCLFPSGHFVPRWIRWAALAQALGPVLAMIPYAPLQAFAGGDAAFFVLFGLLVFAQGYRYRWASTLVQRQQTKWVVLGFVSGLGGFLILLAFLAFSDVTLGAGWTFTAPGILFSDAALSVPLWLIPISIAVAILRSRLWDIDVIIRRTLIYGTLTAIVAGFYFATVIAAQFLSVRLTNQAQPPPWLIVVTTLMIAAAFAPLRRGIQALIDRRFYRRKYDAARTVAAFGATLRTEVDLDDLTDHLLAVVRETMQPEHASLWLRAPARRGDQRPGESPPLAV